MWLLYAILGSQPQPPWRRVSSCFEHVRNLAKIWDVAELWVPLDALMEPNGRSFSPVLNRIWTKRRVRHRLHQGGEDTQWHAILLPDIAGITHSMHFLFEIEKLVVYGYNMITTIDKNNGQSDSGRKNQISYYQLISISGTCFKHPNSTPLLQCAQICLCHAAWHCEIAHKESLICDAKGAERFAGRLTCFCGSWTSIPWFPEYVYSMY